MPQLRAHLGIGNQLFDPEHNMLHKLSNTDIIRILELDVDRPIGKISNEAAACADLVSNDNVFNQQPRDANSYATVVTSVDNVSDEESSSSFTELTPLQVSQTNIIPESQFYANPSPRQKQVRGGNLTEPITYDNMTPGQTTPVPNVNSVAEFISYVNLAPVHVSGTNGTSETISYINLMPVQTQVLSRSQSPRYANTNSTTAVPRTTYTTPMALSTESPTTYTLTEAPTRPMYTITEASTMYTIPMPVSSAATSTTEAPNTYAIGAEVDIGPEAMEEDTGPITTNTYVCLESGFPTTRAEEAFDVTTASGCESVSNRSSSDIDLDSLPATPDQNKPRRASRTRHTTASSDDTNILKRVRKRKPREKKPKLYEMQVALQDPTAEKKRQDAINAKRNRDNKKRIMDHLKKQVDEAFQEKLALQRELVELANRESALRARIHENKVCHSVGVGTR